MSHRAIDRKPARARGVSLTVGLVLAVACGSRGDTTRVKTGRGTFLVEVDAPDLSVRGDGDDVVVVGPGASEVRLRPDPERPDRSTREPVLTMTRDGKPVVTIRRAPSGAPAGLVPGAGRTVLGAGRTAKAWSLAISPDGRTLVSGHQGSLHVWDLATRAERFSVPTGQAVRRVALTPDGSTIATAEYEHVDGKPVGHVVVRDGKTGQALRAGKEVTTGLHGVAIDPAGKVIVSSSWGESAIRVWDAATVAEVGTLKGHSGAVATIGYSPDGKTLASAGDNSVRLWDVDTGATRLVLRGHEKGVESVAFSLDGKVVASGGFDRTGRAWDAATGKPLATVECDEPVLAVAISPDGKTLATASARWGDGFFGQAPAEVQLWDVAAAKLLVRLPGQPGQVFAMAYTPDGQTLVTASLSGAVIAWDLAAFRPRGDAPK